MENDAKLPKVSVLVFVFKDGKVLLGKRKGPNPPEGSYGNPGGSLEPLESIEECAVRELREEAGIEIENVRFLCVTNVRCFAPKHYLAVLVRADWKSGEPQNLEPDRCEGWDWYSVDDLPQPLTPGTEAGFEALENGILLFDAPPDGGSLQALD